VFEAAVNAEAIIPTVYSFGTKFWLLTNLSATESEKFRENLMFTYYKGRVRRSLHYLIYNFFCRPAFYSVGTGVLSQGLKGPRREADRASPSTSEVKKRGAIPPVCHMSS
jgi:hypothetical protein